MGLRGCINIDRLLLQILLKDNPAWAGMPVAVTKEEKPQSPVLALNRGARGKGLAVGMSYASALSLVPSLRARAVPPDRIADARDRIVVLLSSFTPDIEPCPFDMDAFWVSMDGLRSLFVSEALWIEKVRAALLAEGFQSSVVVGFTRFGTYAIARSRSRSMVFASRKEEYELMGRSSIDILPLSQKTKSILRRLEIRTVRQFASLPADETVQRFGREARLLRQAILSEDALPIQPRVLKETVPCGRHLDAPLVDLNLLMPHIDELLAIEAYRTETERSVISGLTLMLRTEEGEVTTDVIRPAVPTLRTPLLSRLVHLRLSSRQFSSGVQDIEIRCARTQPSRVQEELFTVRGRDLQAGARAFAALRARFGNKSVACAQMSDSHLPERSFKWVALKQPILPAPRREMAASGRPGAVRRILFEPTPTRPGRSNASGYGGGIAGPFAASGGWWGTEGNDGPFARDYSFHDSAAGILWLFADRITGTCWLQGTVD
jgi:protein ImuB